jgi:hypothetical protein
MFKTPFLAPLIAAMALAGASVGGAAPILGDGAAAHDHHKASIAGLNAWDGRPLGQAGIAAVGQNDLSAGAGAPAWDAGADHDPVDGVRSSNEFGGAAKLANLNPDAEADALPLSQVGANRAKPAPAVHAALSVWDFVARVRYGRLPEPASWALMLIGFGMIGGALRGFVVANRRLARLQPEEIEEAGP